jgi:flavin reductase (DIM6/NTAB) family NADH-FMN oxidoreductase RutF
MKKSLGAQSLVYPTPVFVVGTYDKQGKPNVMTAAWAGICCSKPPCIYVALREATYTYGNIMERKAFTISIPSEKYIKETDYFGIVSGKEIDKFSVTGLTPVKSGLVDAPYVKEFPFILECALVQSIKLGLHTQFIGEVKDMQVEEALLGANGAPDIEKVKPMIFAPGNRAYFGLGKLLGKAFTIGKEPVKK